jgi:excisionase family DNA binding protein
MYTTMPNRATYTVQEAMRILGFSKNTIYTYLREKKLKGIRLGNGRFRIPASEITRFTGVLPAKEKQATAPPIDGSVTLPAVTIPVRDPSDVFKGVESGADFLLWFDIVIAIMVGVCRFLFPFYPHQEALYGLPFLRIPIALILVLSGLGLLAMILFKKHVKQPAYAKIFKGLLVLSYFILAVQSYLSGIAEGVIVFTMLSLSGILSFFAIEDFILSYFIPAVWFALLSIIVLVLMPDRILLFVAHAVPASQIPIIQISCSLVLAGSIAVYFYSWRKRLWWIFAGNALILTIGLGVIAMMYAMVFHWTFAFMFTFLAGWTALTPFWRLFRFERKMQVRLVSNSFITILILFLLFAIGVWVLQQSFIAYTGKNLVAKVGYAKYYLNDIYRQIQYILDNTDLDETLRTLNAKDNPSVEKILRMQYLTNQSVVSQFVYGDGSGIVRGAYPIDQTILGSDLTKHTHIQELLKTKKVVISTVFESTPGRPGVVIAKPILSSVGEVVGILDMALNTEVIGSNIQRLASETIGEHFLVIDEKGNYVIHPDIGMVGSPMPHDAYAQIQNTPFATSKFITSGIDGQAVIVARDSVNEFSWQVVVVQTLVSGMKKVTTIGIIAFFLAVFFGIIGFLIWISIRGTIEEGGP